jgi:acetyl esterase/lipase
VADGEPEGGELQGVALPARDIAPPSTISPAARAQLSAGALNPPSQRPGPGDIAGWREAVAASEAMWRPIAQAMLDAATATIEDVEIAGVPCYVARPAAGDGGPVYLYFHGGAFVFGGGLFARAHAAANADRLGCTVISVDYRMPPDHPYPAAPEDGLAVYRTLIERHDSAGIAIGGSSAGGNLAAAVTLMIRDRGLAMPGAVVLLTPEVDLTEAGDSFRTNALLDVILKRGLPECNALYAAGADFTDPHVSPLFADFTAGFPPTLVQTGTRDLFLSNSALIHRKLRAAGVPAELHVWEAMPHGGFGGQAPEDQEIFAEVRAFVHRHCTN